MNAETIMVEPIDKSKMATFIETKISKELNQEFMIDTDAIFFHPFKSILLDNECCAGFLSKNEGNWVVQIGIRKSTDTGKSLSVPMSYESYLEISESELRENNLLKPKASLKDFMAGRYNYNPRIIGNMNELIDEIRQITRGNY